MILTIEILGILSMCTFMFVSVWGFILLNRIYSQFKYNNYLLEKLSQHVHLLSAKNTTFDKDSIK